MRRRRRKQRRKRAVKMSCIIAAILFFLSACMLDSNSIAPFVICCVSLTWLGIVAIANDERKEVKEDENRAGCIGRD